MSVIEERRKELEILLEGFNSLAGSAWSLVQGNRRVGCEWLLVNRANGVLLCESNMLGVIREFLNGALAGYKLVGGQPK